jgi:FMN phosphatase YigB (HAD superfamily)
MIEMTLGDVLVVGDDLHSEIKGAQDLGIDTVLYENLQRNQNQTAVPKFVDFRELTQF